MPIKLIFKNISRDWRHKEIKIILLVVMISSLVLSCTALLSHSIITKVQYEGAKILGADLVINSAKPLNIPLKTLSNSTLKTSQAIEFYSMLSTKQQFLLASVTGIASPYPLIASNQLYNPLTNKVWQTNQAPAPNQAWVDQAVLTQLNLKIGNSFKLGEHKFKIIAVIKKLAGSNSQIIQFSPRVVININDIAKTETIQPGSRVRYKQLFAGSTADILKLKKQLQTKKDPHQTITTALQTNQLSTLNHHIFSMLNLGAMFSLILSSISIFIASFIYSQKNYKKIALIRAFGGNNQTIILQLLFSLCFVGAIAISIGAFIAVLVSPILNYYIFSKFIWLFDFKIILNNSLLCLICLMLFSSANLINLIKIEPIYLFKKRPIKDSNLSIFILVLGILFLIAVLFYKTQSNQISYIFLYCLVSFYGLSWLLTTLVIKLFNYFKTSLPLSIKLTIANLYQETSRAVIQIFAISLTLLVILSFYIAKSSLVDHWQQILPKNAPNIFLINLQKDQLSDFKRFLKQYHIKTEPIYPMVRGRLVKINHQPISQLFPNIKKRPRALKRELNLSTMEILPSNNQVIEGRFLAKTSLKRNSVSIEQGLANRLNIRLNDTLTFSVAGTDIDAVVSSIRTVQWTSFKPNFFMILNQRALKDLAKSYITSFFLATNKPDVALKLIKNFPNTSLIQVDSIIKQIQGLVNNAAVALNLIVGTSTLIGAIILGLIFLLYAQKRKKEANILFKLGLQKKHIHRMQSIEPIIIGLISSLLCGTLSYFINFLIISHLLNLPYYPPLTIFIALPLILITVIYLLSRR